MLSMNEIYFMVMLMQLPGAEELTARPLTRPYEYSACVRQLNRMGGVMDQHPIVRGFTCMTIDHYVTNYPEQGVRGHGE